MGFFDKLFGKTKKIQKTSFVDLFTPYFSDFGSDISKSNVVIEAVNSITRHASKLKMTHFTKDAKTGKIKNGRASLNFLLQNRPNPVETGADFLEKAMYHWLVSNNVFIYLHFVPSNVFEGKEMLESMWVLDPYDVKVKIISAEEVYLIFTLPNENYTITTSIENVVCLKRMVGKNPFFGSGNENLKKVLDIIDTNYQGIEQAVKASAYIRFIVESVTVLSKDKRLEKAKEFNDAFLNASKEGGVIYSDASNKITQVNQELKYSNFKEMESFYKAVYNYFGTNEKIISSNYTYDEWNSFFESTIEVFCNKLELELTNKMFSATERSYGNKIVILANKLQNMAIGSRLDIIREVKEIGLLTLNEMRELIYLPPIENGDIREVSLNYVDADKQNEYQVGDKTEIEKPKEEKEEANEET